MPAALGGCLAGPTIDDPAPVEISRPGQDRQARAAAVSEMRAHAAVAEVMEYPDPYADPAVAAPVPLPMSEVAAAQARLLNAPRRSRAASPAELAAGNARAADLRQVGRTHGAAAAEAIRRRSQPQQSQPQ